LNMEYGAVSVDQDLWSLTGNARISSKTSWNLLGGFVEFDMNNTGVEAEINAALYLSSPAQPNCGLMCYCDINSGPCMEMDIVENNGNCLSATTIHTWYSWDGGCDRGGCQAKMHSSGKRQFKAAFSSSGRMTVTIGGQANDGYSPYPDSGSDQFVQETMQSIGAVLISTQWTGWVPGDNECPSGGSLDGSTFTVNNVRVYGTVMQGPTPPLCGDPGPTPTPGPDPTPTPKPENCATIWNQCGGEGYNGPTCCNGICKCKYVNDYYSMCGPDYGNSCYQAEEPLARLIGSEPVQA